MKICIISAEIMGFGKIGGFGNMTRKLAIKLTQDGHKVTVVVPKRKVQKKYEQLNGFTVIGLSPFQLLKRSVFKNINADIYHSQNPTISTTMALKAQPKKIHLVTLRDPRNINDWKIEFQYNKWKRKYQIYLTYLFEGELFLKRTIKKVDLVGVPAHFLIKKVGEIYKQKDSVLLPNLEKIPMDISNKSKKPLVCFVGRLDKVKNPERFFKLVGNFPNIDFIVAGAAQDLARQSKFELSKPQNVKLTGAIDKFNSQELDNIYKSSWVIVNTSYKEALPSTFIEAAGHGCAILSNHDPDKFATKFGYHCKNDDFEEGLNYLLENNRWKGLGQKAHNYVKTIYQEDIAYNVHLDIYNNLMATK